MSEFGQDLLAKIRHYFDTSSREQIDADLKACDFDKYNGIEDKITMQLSKNTTSITSAPKSEFDEIKGLLWLPKEAASNPASVPKPPNDEVRDVAFECVSASQFLRFEAAQNKAAQLIEDLVRRRVKEAHEEHAWEISPAMAQAQIDQQNATIDQLRRELEGEREHVRGYVAELNRPLWEEFYAKGSPPAGWRCLVYSAIALIQQQLAALQRENERLQNLCTTKTEDR